MNILEKVDEFLSVEGLKTNWHVLAVGFAFSIALYLRYMPEQGMQYLQALDPYMIYRLSQHLALEGNMPAVDFLRYFPYNAPVHLLNQGDIIFPAVFYWMGPFLFFGSFLEWAQFYPALMGSLSVIMAYFLGKELFDKLAGVSTAFFLATIAGVMHRTSAGFFEKEPIGTFFMMCTLYFFTRAWKRDEWFSGIISGLSLGFFTISWGGSRMTWLLYPLVVGVVIFFNEDIRSLIRAYTPTVIVGGGVAMAMNPSRFWFTGSLFIANLGLLGLLWSRYFVEEFEIIEKQQLKYYIPSMYMLGTVFLALSPLFSDFFANKVLGIISKVTQSSGAVIAGTVAENTASSLGQIVTQLGSSSAISVNPFLGILANIAGTWPLAFIGVALLGNSVIMMLGRKYNLLSRKISSNSYYQLFGVTLLAWVLVFAIFFQDAVMLAVLPAIVGTIGGMALLYTFTGFEGEKNIEFKWYYLLPFLWIVSNILGAVAKSRLVFLAAFPVALSAGYTLSVMLNRLKALDYTKLDQENAQKIRVGVVTSVAILILLISTASGFAAAQRLGGSPNQAWMQNLDYMENETPEGSVILSWWDYGYWFESIGRRAAVADGSNAGYYTDDILGKTNYPIADYLTADGLQNHTELFEKHSVDYLVLDNTMVGKYAAVSQISNRDNSKFESMIQLSTPRSLSRSVSEGNGNTVAEFTGRGLTVYAPFNTTRSEAYLSGPATLEVQGQRQKIGCILTEKGRKTFNVSRSGRYCLAEDPHLSLERGLSVNSQARVALVPKKIADSNLVRLYLMDGYGIDYVEKVPEASNGFVKMWKITDLP